MNNLISALHDATHHVPGVPAHRENQLPHQLSPRLRQKRPHLQSPERHHQTPQHHQTPPRVLIAWQSWISQLVGHSNHQ